MSPILIAGLVGAYLLGSIPFGLALTRIAGLGDIRNIGSGNIGATNVLRTGRKDLALATLLLDAGKGGIAVLIFFSVGLNDYAAFAGAAAFLGHCFPVFLGFKGGKGVATFFGTLFAINWMVGLVTGAVWLLTAVLFRMSSLSALIASALAPVVSYQLSPTGPHVAVAVMTLLIYYRHWANIKRIIAGEEPKIGQKGKAEPKPDAMEDETDAVQ